MSLEVVSRHTVYKAVLKEAADGRIGRTGDGLPSDEARPNCSTQTSAAPSPVEKMPGDAVLLSDKAREIIFGQKESAPDEKEKRNKNSAVTKLKALFPALIYVIQFLKDCYLVFDLKDICALDDFISKYKDSHIEALSQYASGLLDDYKAVKNSLVYTHISNGPLEGKNSRIKMIHRRSGGRAGLLLLNAYMALR